MKNWFIVSIVLVTLYLSLGIYLVISERPLAIWTFLIAFVAIIGIVQYKKKNFKATKILFIISGIMGFPLGVLLIIAGVQINKIANKTLKKGVKNVKL